jgi:uncharacterized protein YdhG (YjbR/CyaY superfamily)
VVRKSKNDPLAVDAYLATLPRAERESLQALRKLIKDAIPHVGERVSYGTAVMFSLGSGATIHFSPQHPLPARLVKKILRARVRENALLHPKL